MKALSIKQLNHDGFFYWLSGFIDGEGCFFFHNQHTSFPKPHFQLKLRDDDRNILDECVRRTKLGYIRSVARKDASQAQCVWLIIRRKDCIELVKILDECPLRAKKLRDYLIWREAVMLWANKKNKACKGGGTTGYGITDDMKRLKALLESGRKYKEEQ